MSQLLQKRAEESRKKRLEQLMQERIEKMKNERQQLMDDRLEIFKARMIHICMNPQNLDLMILAKILEGSDFFLDEFNGASCIGIIVKKQYKETIEAMKINFEAVFNTVKQEIIGRPFEKEGINLSYILYHSVDLIEVKNGWAKLGENVIENKLVKEMRLFWNFAFINGLSAIKKNNPIENFKKTE